MKHTILASTACALILSANPVFAQAAKTSTISGVPEIPTNSIVPLGRPIIKKNEVKDAQEVIKLEKKEVAKAPQQ
jgi:hypothetical protein